jgi:hypothetical protein
MVRGLTLLLVALAAASASASPLRLQVTGDACDFASLEPQLAQMLGADPVDANASASVQIEITNASEAHVSFDDADGHVRGPRVVTAANCRDLVKSVAIVIATALPDVQAEPPGSDSEPQAVVAEPVSTSTPTVSTISLAPVAAEVDVAPASNERSHSHTDVYAAGAAGIASTGADGQAIIGVRVRRNAASISAEIRGDAPQQFSADRMGSVDVSRAQLSLSPCMSFGAFAACAVAGAGTIHGSGAGLTSAREAYTPLLTAGLRMTWEQPLTRRIALRIHVDADALLTMTRFDVDNMTVWQSPRFEASAGLGVLAHFP